MANSYTRRINLYINGKEVRNDVASISAEFKKLSGQLAHTTRGSDEYNRKMNELRKLRGMLDEHNQALRGVSGTFGKLNAMFKGLLPAIGLSFGTSTILNFGKELVKLGGQAQGIRAAFYRIADDTFLNQLRESTHGTVSDLELMKNSIKANNFQIPLQSLGKLFEFAAARAQQTGDSVQYLVESIILGIGRKSPLILDNLGISAVMLRERLKGVSAEAADIGDVAQVVGDIAAEELQKMGGYLETNATKISQIKTTWENFKEQLATSNSVINTVSGSLGLLTTIISQVDYLMTAARSKRFNLWDIFLGPASGTRILKDLWDWRGAEGLKKIQKEASAVVNEYNAMYAGAKTPDIGNSKSNAGKSLLEIQKGLLEVAKAMPEATEKEITAKNRKVQAIEAEIKRLSELGKIERPKVSAFKVAESSLTAGYKHELSELKESLLQKKITKAEYDQEQYILELAHLAAMRELYLKHGDDIENIDNQVLDKKLAWQTKLDEMMAISSQVDQNLAEDERKLFSDLLSDWESYSAEYTEIQNEQTQSLIKNEIERREALEASKELEIQRGYDLAASAVENATTFAEAGKAVLNSIREQIRARLSEAISIQITKALVKIPFPFNIAAAAAAAGAVSLLFNKLIPEFETGGYTTRGQADQPAGVVHRGEWVAPKWMVEDPSTGPLIRALEMARTKKINPDLVNGKIAFRSGGFAGDPLNPELLSLLKELKNSLDNHKTATELFIKWKPKVATELIKRDLDELGSIESSRGL